MALFNVLFDIAAKTASFEAAMTGVERRFNNLISLAKTTAGAVGVAFSTDAIVQHLDNAIDSGEKLFLAMQKVGASAEALSGLKYAAQSTGVEFDTLTTALEKMQKTISTGGVVFAQIGVNLSKLKSLSVDQQFETIATAISRLKDPADRTRATLELFGKGAGDLIPLLSSGGQGIETLRAKAQSLGITLSGTAVKALHDAHDAMDDLNTSSTSLWQTLATKLSPTIATAFRGITSLLAAPSDYENFQNLKDQLKDLLAQRQLLQAQANGAPIVIGHAVVQAKIDPAALKAINEEINALRAKVEAARSALFKSESAGATNTSALTKALGFGPDQLQEIRLRVRRGGLTIQQEIEKYYIGLDHQTQTAEERLETETTDFKYAIQELLDHGSITPALAAARQAAFNELHADDLTRGIDYISTSVKHIKTSTEQTYDALRDATREASLDMASSFEQFFINPIQYGIKGLVNAFITAIETMLAKQATLRLFGADGESGALGSWFSSLFSSLTAGGTGGGAGGGAGGLAGARAGGGDVAAGRSYLVGERGAEIFTPRSSGTVAANGSGWGGSQTVQVNYNIDARGATTDLVAALPKILKVHADSVKSDIINGLRIRKYAV